MIINKGNRRLFFIQILKVYYGLRNDPSGISPMIKGIEKIKKKLFGWIFEHKYNDRSNHYLNALLSISISNGNVHALIEIIEKNPPT